MSSKELIHKAPTQNGRELIHKCCNCGSQCHPAHKVTCNNWCMRCGLWLQLRQYDALVRGELQVGV